MICPNCKKENVNKYATECAYCRQDLYPDANKEELLKEFAKKQKSEKVKSAIMMVIAFILVIAVVIVALKLPKSEKEPENTTTGSVETSITANNGESTTNGTADGVKDPTTGNKNNETTTKANSGLPETTEEIVAYFNQNANRVKTEATKVVKNYEDREVSNIQASDLLKRTAGGVMDAAFKDDTDPITYGTREEIVENFQVPKQSYVSKLTAEDVAEATFTEDGNRYIVTIRVKDEKNPVVGKGVGSAFDIIESSEVQAKAPSFVKDFSTDYRNCVVKAIFDKATGRMISANYIVRLTLFVTAFSEDASMDLSFEKDYTITY